MFQIKIDKFFTSICVGDFADKLGAILNRTTFKYV